MPVLLINTCMADTNKLAPPPTRLTRPVRKKAGIGRRANRMPEEDVPALDYIKRMEKLGPRDGESKLAYVKRMAAIVAARDLWFSVWIEHGGNKEACADAVGIPRNNLAYELRLVGLSSSLLNSYLIKANRGLTTKTCKRSRRQSEPSAQKGEDQNAL